MSMRKYLIRKSFYSTYFTQLISWVCFCINVDRMYHVNKVYNKRTYSEFKLIPTDKNR